MNRLLIIFIILFSFVVYSVKGQVEYLEIAQIDLISTHSNAMDFSDVDGDGDTDFSMAGFEETGAYRTSLYLNDGNGNFSKVLDTNFPPVFEPSIIFFDLDGDTYEDLFISGTDSSDEGHLDFYVNDGNGNFTPLPPGAFPDLPGYGFAADFSDIDNDGDQDLCLIGGSFIAEPHAQIYFNNGTGIFTEDTESELQAVNNGTVDFNDIDNDGDPDLLISGFDEALSPNTNLYKNDGTGKFEILNSSNLSQLGLSTVAFSDIDGDSDQDFIISGRPGNFPSSIPTTIIYKNDGAGSFVEDSDNLLSSINFNSLALGDVDGDSDDDLLISGGATWTSTEQTNLYLNDGTGTFTEILNDFFEPIRRGSVALEEITGDNKLDIIFSGLNSSNQDLSIIKIYESQNILGLKQPPSNSMIESYFYLNLELLSIQLVQQYKDVEIKVCNILGQITKTQHFKDVDELQIMLNAQPGIKFIIIQVDSQETGVLKIFSP